MFNKKYLFIEFGVEDIRLGMASRNNEELSIKDDVRITLPENSYKDGRILNEKEAVRLLAEAMEKNRLKASDAIFSICSPDSVYLKVEAPSDKLELVNQLADQAVKRHIPNGYSNYVIQSKVVGSRQINGGAVYDVKVCAVPKRIVASCLSVVRNLKLEPEALELFRCDETVLAQYKARVTQESKPGIAGNKDVDKSEVKDTLSRVAAAAAAAQRTAAEAEALAAAKKAEEEAQQRKAAEEEKERISDKIQAVLKAAEAKAAEAAPSTAGSGLIKFENKAPETEADIEKDKAKADEAAEKKLAAIQRIMNRQQADNPEAAVTENITDRSQETGQSVAADGERTAKEEAAAQRAARIQAALKQAEEQVATETAELEAARKASEERAAQVEAEERQQQEAAAAERSARIQAALREAEEIAAREAAQLEMARKASEETETEKQRATEFAAVEKTAEDEMKKAAADARAARIQAALKEAEERAAAEVAEQEAARIIAEEAVAAEKAAEEARRNADADARAARIQAALKEAEENAAADAALITAEEAVGLEVARKASEEAAEAQRIKDEAAANKAARIQAAIKEAETKAAAEAAEIEAARLAKLEKAAVKPLAAAVAVAAIQEAASFVSEDKAEVLTEKQKAADKKEKKASPKKAHGFALPSFSFGGKTFLSIEMGSQNIKLIKGTFKGGVVNVDTAFVLKTPPASYDDGRLLVSEKIAEDLEAVLKLQGIKNLPTVVTVNSTGIITRDVVVPDTKPEEMAQMVQYEVQKFLPIEVDQYVVQFKQLEGFKEGNASKSRIQVAAMQKESVISYLELVKGLGLRPFALDTGANAQSNLFTADSLINGSIPVADKTIAVVDMGHQYSNISIYHDGNLKLNRSVDGGGNDVTISIADFLQIPETNAEEQKIGMGSGTSEELKQPVKLIMETWVMKIQRIFQFFESRNQGLKVSEIYIYGGSSKLEGIDHYMTEIFGLPVRQLKNVSVIGKLPADPGFDSTLFINTIGALAAKR